MDIPIGIYFILDELKNGSKINDLTPFRQDTITTNV